MDSSLGAERVKRVLRAARVVFRKDRIEIGNSCCYLDLTHFLSVRNRMIPLD
jgi:hypothetical protein